MYIIIYNIIMVVMKNYKLIDAHTRYNYHVFYIKY